MNKIDLSVIILSYNTSSLLDQCLKSVLNSKLNRHTMEVIVVDNNSTDDSVSMVQDKYNKKVNLIVSKKNLGFSGGNNLGLKKAKGRYILFLNSDTEVDPETFSKIIDFMDKNPQVGATSVKTMLYTHKMDPDCHRGFPTPWASITYFLGLEKLFPKSRIFGQYHQMYLDLNKVHPIDAGAGAFLFVRKDVLDKIGHWDEDYFFYGEDLDLFYRIKQAGWEIAFYPEPLVKHYKGASSGLRKEAKKMGINKASKETRVKVAKESIKAMETFYGKFYSGKYPKWLTFFVILAIKTKGMARLLKAKYL